MATHRFGVLAGDGIGPEIVPPTQRAMEAAAAMVGAPAIEWVELPSGFAGLEAAGDTLPAETHAALGALDAWVVGPHHSSGYPEPWVRRLSPHARLRREYELFANLRPARNIPGVPAVTSGMDLVIVRENSEGFYADNAMHEGSGQFMPTSDVALSVAVFSDRAGRRIAHQAFQLAKQRRGKVTVVHKALLKSSLGRYLRAACEVAADYPGIELDEVHIDACTVHLVRDPSRFDVLLTENMHGDILSDLAGELAGALGMAPSLNAGTDRAMAQAAHGCAPDIAGRGIANPVGMMLSGALLLRWLGSRAGTEAFGSAGDVLERTVFGALAEGRGTRDLRRDDDTASFSEAVLAMIGRDASGSEGR